LGGRGRQISRFEASLVYKVSSRTVRAIQRNPVSKTKKTNKKKERRKKKREREKGKKMDLPQEGTQEPLLSAPLPSRRSWAFEKLKNVGHFSLGKIPKQEIFKYL
jgi:hypothetical protein